MNAEATELLKTASPMQQTRTHRALYVEDDQVIVPELIYESKYTPNAVTVLLQHALERKEGTSDKREESTNGHYKSRQISNLRRSDYISPIPALDSQGSSPQHWNAASPTGRQVPKVKMQHGTLMYESPASPTVAEVKEAVTASPDFNYGKRNIVHLDLQPGAISVGSPWSPIRHTPSSPNIHARSLRRQVTLTTHHAASHPLSEHASSEPEPASHTALVRRRNPAPSRVQSRISGTSYTQPDREGHRSLVRSAKAVLGAAPEPSISIRSMVKDMLAPPAPQVYCASPSLRSKFLDNYPV